MIEQTLFHNSGICLFSLFFHFPIVPPAQSSHRMPDSFNYVDRTRRSIADRTWRSIPTDHLDLILFHLLLKRGPDSLMEFYNYILQTIKADNDADSQCY